MKPLLIHLIVSSWLEHACSEHIFRVHCREGAWPDIVQGLLDKTHELWDYRTKGLFGAREQLETEESEINESGENNN